MLLIDIFNFDKMASYFSSFSTYIKDSIMGEEQEEKEEVD
jgi:hypothetical protein